MRNIRPVAWALGLYFVLMAADCLRLGRLGSGAKLLALLPTALALLDAKDLRLRGEPLPALLGLFFFFACCSVLYSVDAERSLEAVGSLGLNLALVLVLGGLTAFSEAELKLLTYALVAGSWLTALLMLLTGGTGRLTLDWGVSAADENGINGYLLFAFAYHVNRAFRRRRHLLPAAALWVLAMGTGSRGAMLAWAVAAVCAAFFAAPRRWAGRILLLGAMALGAAGLSYLLLPGEVWSRYTWSYYLLHGTTGRLRIWNALWQYFLHSGPLRQLFGHGYGTTRLLLYEGVVAHNLYLDDLLSLGLLGLLLRLAAQAAGLLNLLLRRNWMLLTAYVGLLGMCLSLSLVNYKPLWNVMLLAMAWSHPAAGRKQVHDALSSDNSVSPALSGVLPDMAPVYPGSGPGGDAGAGVSGGGGGGAGL